ncbi:hypothetical protein B0J11DRAFT_481399 [Dendryphion nanum]|uniref:Homeobox domain-containing protein n=1 Tax=Dendryphion nanum TaxID=256645 RepID=A0A9P9E7A1_9PLEO|nr:hypothetical protein B0J11DRAFT_481399 [Dendryphion nanum]
MSESTSTPPSSSPHATSRTPNTSFAFLVHSPDTVANALPPDVDNKPLARQKRRRTRYVIRVPLRLSTIIFHLSFLARAMLLRPRVHGSLQSPTPTPAHLTTPHHTALTTSHSKEDEEILKAEYLKNTKPDKAARIEIVSKVALGEKEVQIWFQNKRQNDRRRSRPLEPSSTASFMSSSSNMSDPITEDESGLRDTEPAHAEDQNDESTKLNDPADLEEAEVKPELDPASTSVPATATTTTATTAAPAESASAEKETSTTEATELNDSQQSQQLSHAAEKARTSWISNRRSASFRCGDDYVPEVISFPQPTPTTEQPVSTRPLKRTHSFVRLSMTDGTARVITDADKTPSPPHPKSNPATLSRAAAGLRRSYSAAGLNERLAAAAAAAAGEERSPKMPRIASNIGRSRDSRAWEFWCDTEVRQNRSLTTRADQEQSGSAADAIGLLRANRRVLAQNNARQNTNTLARITSRMSDEHGVKKSRGSIQRASTTHGRLQTKENKKADSSESDELPQTESDKENWEPEIPQVRRQRQPTTPMNSQRQRQILGENTEIMSQSQSLGAMLAREKDGRGAGENSDPEQDDELRRFMNNRDGSARTSLSSAEEAGCVEGLLKLSQGNWR